MKVWYHHKHMENSAGFVLFTHLQQDHLRALRHRNAKALHVLRLADELHNLLVEVDKHLPDQGSAGREDESCQ